jgi:phage tail-like protein
MNGGVTMQWTLRNAWPTKISSTDLKSDGNEVAVDTLEIAYEDLDITNKQG